MVADDNAGTRHFAAADTHQRNAARISAEFVTDGRENGRRFFLSGECAVFQTDMEIDFEDSLPPIREPVPIWPS